MEKEGSRFLVVLRLGSTSPQRLTDLIPALQDTLQGLSTEPIEQAFRSATADVFGYFIRAKRYASQIYSAIQSPGLPAHEREPDTTYMTEFLDNQDHLMVLEIGEDFRAGQGFSRVGAWLQHH